MSTKNTNNSSSNVNDKGNKEKFENLWQGILPELEPLPRAVNAFNIMKEQIASSGTAPKKTSVSDSTLPLMCTEPTAESTHNFLKCRILQESATCKFYKALSKKCPPKIARALASLEKSQQQVLTRLETVYFLKTGYRNQPANACPYIYSIPHALRNLCNEESDSYEDYICASGKFTNLRTLYEDLADTKAAAARTLESVLETIIGG